LQQRLKQVPFIAQPLRIIAQPLRKARNWVWQSKQICSLKLEDVRVTAHFWANRTRRRELRNDLGRCHSVSDYHRLAQAAFGLTQMESEIIRFIEAAAAQHPKTILEIGVDDGGTNFLLGRALPTVDLLVGIDLFVKGKNRLRYFAKPDQELHYIDGCSYSIRTVERFKSVLGPRTLDILFIDGDHSHDGVRQDFLRYRSFVREGGLIAFHDICPDHFSRFGRNTGRWAGGVPAFWTRVRTLYDAEEFVENPEQDGLGIGVLRYDPAVKVPDDL
jgi:predicted O-methyltransferase YrrM